MSDIVDYLYSLRNRGAKLGLERVKRLLEALGNPQKEFRSIVVGGTGGKGSTVAMLSSILKEAGFRTGMFTSPHLSSLTERIGVDGKEISESELEEIVSRIREAIERMEGEDGFEHPTFFEVITAAAFCYFKEQEADFAVLEVGLGGRLDATNVTSPLVSVITNVSLEHTRILGNSIKEIAREKGGIIQKNGILVTAAGDKAIGVFEGMCKERDSEMVRIGKDITFTRLDSSIKGQRFRVEVPGRSYELFTPLLGRHQLENAACAVGTVYGLGLRNISIPAEAVAEGLKKVEWPGRLEIMQHKPLVVLDAAKDAQAMNMLKETVTDLKYKKLILVLSISSDKNIGAMVDEIVPLSDAVVVTAHKVRDRAADPEAIAEEVKRRSKDYIIVSDVPEAVEKAISMAKKEDLVLVTGSLFTVAEARERWLAEGKVRLGKDFNEIPRK